MLVDILQTTRRVIRALAFLTILLPGLANAHGNTADDQTIAYWPPAIHPDGVVRGRETKLVKGLYTFITPEGFSPSSYLLRVRQIDYSSIPRTAIGPLTVLFVLVLVLIAYECSQSKRLRGWRVQRRY